MGTIKALYRRAQALNIDQVIETALDETVDKGEFFEDQLRKQLTAGFDKTGARLRPYKSRAYAAKKHSQNPLPGYGNPDYRLSGRTHRGLHAESTREFITVRSPTHYFKFLLKRDPGAFSLGGQYKKDFIDQRLRPTLFTHIRKKLKL